MKYLDTITQKVKTERGTVKIPLLTKNECLKQFKIQRIFWLMDATNREKVAASMANKGSLAELHIQILKLFDGAGDFPNLTVYTKSGDSVDIDFTESINLTSWLEKYYIIKSVFAADRIPLPKFWSKIELTCGKLVIDKPHRSSSGSDINRGQKLHRKILQRHPRIDSFYYRPLLYGELTSSPRVIINIPAKDWYSLSEAKKKLLCKYVASLVPKVKANPFRYTRIPSSAPIAWKVRSNITNMTNQSWGIAIGRITPDGHDIELDKIVRCK